MILPTFRGLAGNHFCTLFYFSRNSFSIFWLASPYVQAFRLDNFNTWLNDWQTLASHAWKSICFINYTASQQVHKLMHYYHTCSTACFNIHFLDVWVSFKQKFLFEYYSFSPETASLFSTLITLQYTESVRLDNFSAWLCDWQTLASLL